MGIHVQPQPRYVWKLQESEVIFYEVLYYHEPMSLGSMHVLAKQLFALSWFRLSYCIQCGPKCGISDNFSNTTISCQAEGLFGNWQMSILSFNSEFEYIQVCNFFMFHIFLLIQTIINAVKKVGLTPGNKITWSTCTAMTVMAIWAQEQMCL